jgi:hypothetical protein
MTFSWGTLITRFVPHTKDGQAAGGISIREQLRWHTDRFLPLMGWPGILAIGLLVMCIPLYFSTIQPMQSSLETLKLHESSIKEQSSNHTKVEHGSNKPIEQLAEFYGFLPAEKESPHWLGLMVDIASKNGLTLNHGEYAVVRDSVGKLRRFKITIPVQGTYPQIRKYLAVLLAEIPSMSLENVQFERKDIMETELQAKIILVLYLRHGS